MFPREEAGHIPDAGVHLGLRLRLRLAIYITFAL